METHSTAPQAANATLPSGTPWVLYDGACPLCRREIAHYRRVAGAETIAWIDIADPALAMPIDGIDHATAMATFHVRDAGGNWRTAADAFVELWSHLRGYRVVARVVRALGMVAPMNWAYHRFARWRLDGRCDDGRCELGVSTGDATQAPRGTDK